MIKNKKLITLIIIGIVGFFLLLNFMHKEESASEESEQEATVSDTIELKPDAIKQAGISTIKVIDKPLLAEIITTGEIKINADKRFTVNSIVSGRITQDLVKLGDYITKGQIVAIVQNPEIIQIHSNFIRQLRENEIAIRQAKTKYSLAKVNYEREKKLYDEGISPKKDLIQAQSDLEIAKADVENFMQKSALIKSEAKSLLTIYGVNSGLNSGTLATSNPVTSLGSGVVTKKNVTVGTMVAPEQVLYEVTDLDNLWLDLTIYSKDIAKVKEGQEVIFKTDSLPDREFAGKIDYIQPLSDESTQTFLVRAFINNSHKLLKPGMFGEVTITSDLQQIKPFVPDAAIQKYSKEYFVFLDLGDGKYKKQVVQPGEKVSGGHFISDGIKAGDKIVGEGSFTLKSELLKSEFAEEE